jgi:tRNA-2-methylthio-N6-dimethylallyladenosine synthase
MQSGSNKILKAMHRTYTAEKFVDLVRRVREARKGIAITTDVIVGFPGETEEDYQQTRALVEEIKFDNAFVFRYSPRRDTPAAEMADQVEENIKVRRNHDLLEVVNESALSINERLIGRTLEVLCEGPSKTNPSRLMGRTGTNKIVVFEGSDDLVGTFVDVRIERATGFSLLGRPSSPSAMPISSTASHEVCAR